MFTDRDEMVPDRTKSHIIVLIHICSHISALSADL